MRGQDIEGFELAADVAEDPLQILQHTGRELIDEKGAAWLQHAATLAQDALAHRSRDGAEGDAGDYVAGLFMAVLAQNLVDRLCGGLYDVEALVLAGRAQKAHELRVGFYGNENRVRAH